MNKIKLHKLIKIVDSDRMAELGWSREDMLIKHDAGYNFLIDANSVDNLLKTFLWSYNNDWSGL